MGMPLPPTQNPAATRRLEALGAQTGPNESAEGVPSWDQIKQMREEAKAQRGLSPEDAVEPDPNDPEAMENAEDLEFRKFAEEFSSGGLGEEAQSSLAAERSQMPDFLPPGMKQLMQKYSVMNQPPPGGMPMPPGPGGPKPPGMP